MVVASDAVKCPHLSSKITLRVKDIDDASVVCQLFTDIDNLQHKFPYLIQEILYLRMFLGVAVVAQKGLT